VGVVRHRPDSGATDSDTEAAFSVAERVFWCDRLSHDSVARRLRALRRGAVRQTDSLPIGEAVVCPSHPRDGMTGQTAKTMRVREAALAAVLAATSSEAGLVSQRDAASEFGR
jgi:hypothetical protein